MNLNTARNSHFGSKNKKTFFDANKIFKMYKYLEMITGTGAATFPTSSSVCIIFLIRAYNTIVADN